MKLKRIFGAVLLLAAITGRTQTQTTTWSTTLSIDWESQYVGFGNGGVFYDKPMFQSDLCFAHNPSGVRFDVWWGTGLNDNFSGGWDDEWDWNIAKSGKIGWLAYDVGIGYWDVYDVFSQMHGDIIHTFVEGSHSFTVSSNLTLTPFVKWQGYFLPFGGDVEGGTLTSAGTKYCLSLSEKVSLTGLTSFGWDDGGFGFEPGLIWKVYANLEWKCTKSLTIRAPTVQFYQPIGISDGRTAQVVYGAGITYCF